MIIKALLIASINILFYIFGLRFLNLSLYSLYPVIFIDICKESFENMSKTLEIKDFKIKIKMGFVPIILLILDVIYEGG